MKSSGPSTEPCGAPGDRRSVEEVQMLMVIDCCLSVRYDLNEDRAVQVMLRVDSRQERRKDPVRSRKRRTLRGAAVSGRGEGCW